MKNMCDHWELEEFPYINLSPDNTASQDNRAWQGCPSVAVTKGGRVFAAWFSGGMFEPCIHNYNLLVMSDDYGESWSEPILTVGTDYENRIRMIDMELWVSPENHLWVMWTQSPYYETSRPVSIKNGGFFDYQREFTCTDVMICRDPDAPVLEWEQPRYLCDGFTRNKPIKTTSGRIIVPAYDFSGDKYTFRISDDGGKTFYTTVSEGKPDVDMFDEMTLYEKTSGILRYLARTDRGHYLQGLSLDDGLSWSPAHVFEKAPSTRCYIGKLQCGMVAYIRSISDAQRTGMKILLSRDGGETFPYEMVLDEREDVSYPELAEDGWGNLYIIYDRERDNRIGLDQETWLSTAAKEILLCRITVEDVIKGKLSENSFVQRVISKAQINEVVF